MKKLFFSAALLMGFAAVSFAGNPKDAKNTNGTEAKAKQNLVWYKVTYDATHPQGYIPSGTAIEATGDRSEAEALETCPEGSNFDCLRGFESTPTLPTNSAGDDQITTPVQP